MKWEYRVLPSDTLHRFDGMDCQAMLTEQGEKGWELVTIRPAPAMEGYDYFVFKRMVMVELSSDFTVHVGENIQSWQPLLDAMQAERL